MDPKNLTPEQIAENRQAFQDAYNGSDNKSKDNLSGDVRAPGQRLAMPAEATAAAAVWLRLSGSATYHDNGTATLTDEGGNDWEFDVKDGSVTGARVLYDADEEQPEGSDLDIDLLGQLTAEETREAQELFGQYNSKFVLSCKHISEEEHEKQRILRGKSVVLTGNLGTYHIQHDGYGKIIDVRRDTGRPEINLEDQPAITQSQLYRETLATGHQDAEAQIVRNEIGLAIQILRNMLVLLRSDVAEVSAAAESRVTTGDILSLYFQELLEYKGQLDSGKDTTEAQDRRAFFIMAVIAYYKTNYEFLQNPTKNQLPANMRNIRRR